MAVSICAFSFFSGAVPCDDSIFEILPNGIALILGEIIDVFSGQAFLACFAHDT